MTAATPLPRRRRHPRQARVPAGFEPQPARAHFIEEGWVRVPGMVTAGTVESLERDCDRLVRAGARLESDGTIRGGALPGSVEDGPGEPAGDRTRDIPEDNLPLLRQPCVCPSPVRTPSSSDHGSSGDHIAPVCGGPDQPEGGPGGNGVPLASGRTVSDLATATKPGPARGASTSSSRSIRPTRPTEDSRCSAELTVRVDGTSTTTPPPPTTGSSTRAAVPSCRFSPATRCSSTRTWPTDRVQTSQPSPADWPRCGSSGASPERAWVANWPESRRCAAIACRLLSSTGDLVGTPPRVWQPQPRLQAECDSPYDRSAPRSVARVSAGRTDAISCALLVPPLVEIAGRGAAIATGRTRGAARSRPSLQ